MLTSRGTAWCPVTDLKLCQQHLKYIELAPTDEGGQADGSSEEDNSLRIGPPYVFVFTEACHGRGNEFAFQ